MTSSHLGFSLYRDIEEYMPKTIADHSAIENSHQPFAIQNTPQKSISQLAQKLSAIKRFQPLRTQTRAGGVVLCLWKVCPAAPWLVSERLK
ncbi:hypothetical protein ScPMuIL_008334 [Solemya velum]